MSSSTENNDLKKRIVVVEESLMHAEHLLENLNQVFCAAQDTLDEHSRELKRLRKTIDHLSSDEPEDRSLEDERPPHY